ncbi:hypothetical protein C8R46DRAFT_1039200 [Mycena filopes]|nr:hypothetical protein C8R46DRAFT_1039200 [Mycena filopes]
MPATANTPNRSMMMRSDTSPRPLPTARTRPRSLARLSGRYVHSLLYCKTNGPYGIGVGRRGRHPRPQLNAGTTSPPTGCKLSSDNPSRRPAPKNGNGNSKVVMGAEGTLTEQENKERLVPGLAMKALPDDVFLRELRDLVLGHPNGSGTAAHSPRAGAI